MARRRPPYLPTLTLIISSSPRQPLASPLFLFSPDSPLVSHPLTSRPLLDLSLLSSSRAPVRGRGLVPVLADGTAMETHHLDLAQTM